MSRSRSHTDRIPVRVRQLLLHGTVRLARTLANEPSSKALHRFEVVRWYEEHGGAVRLTARHFGYSPDTVSRWVRAFAQQRMTGLEDRSRRPKRVRTPTTPSLVVIRIRELRERYPRWGREKLRVLLARDGIRISAKTIDRVLVRLRARGELHEPQVVWKAMERRRARLARSARPTGLVVDRPGFLQLDTQDVRGEGGRAYTFAAVDYLTRKRVIAAASRITSGEGARFFERAQREFPFPIWAVQTDGGSEFMADFAAAAKAAGVAHYVNRPNYPQGQGRVERSFLTDVLECYEVEEWPRGVDALDRRLTVWNRIYEDVRPHQALGYLTPNEFYAKWLAEHASAAAPVSDIS